ncbi:hypothetical protein F-S17_0215 [Faustovirus]|nr:hypothetical protein F-S17_0215 [Faustovirus]QJX73990.1 hypothetical protein F-E9_236 [Faustovirus]
MYIRANMTTLATLFASKMAVVIIDCNNINQVYYYDMTAHIAKRYSLSSGEYPLSDIVYNQNNKRNVILSDELLIFDDHFQSDVIISEVKKYTCYLIKDNKVVFVRDERRTYIPTGIGKDGYGHQVGNFVQYLHNTNDCLMPHSIALSTINLCKQILKSSEVVAKVLNSSF